MAAEQQPRRYVFADQADPVVHLQSVFRRFRGMTETQKRRDEISALDLASPSRLHCPIRQSQHPHPIFHPIPSQTIPQTFHLAPTKLPTTAAPKTTHPSANHLFRILHLEAFPNPTSPTTPSANPGIQY